MLEITSGQMLPKDLARFAGLAAVTAGGMRIVAAAIPYVPDSAELEALYALIDLGFLFGTAGIFLAVWPRVGVFGAIGAGLLMAGVASIVGPDAVFHGVDMYQAGLGVIALGSAVFAVALLRTGQFELTSWAWIAAAVLGIGGTVAALPELGMLAGAVFGFAYLVAGIRLMRG